MKRKVLIKLRVFIIQVMGKTLELTRKQKDKRKKDEKRWDKHDTMSKGKCNKNKHDTMSKGKCNEKEYT